MAGGVSADFRMSVPLKVSEIRDDKFDALRAIVERWEKKMRKHSDTVFKDGEDVASYIGHRLDHRDKIQVSEHILGCFAEKEGKESLEGIAFYTVQRDELYINYLAIAPRNIRHEVNKEKPGIKGIGSALIEKIVNVAKKRIVRVTAIGDSAEAFYLKQGFVRVSTEDPWKLSEFKMDKVACDKTPTLPVDDAARRVA